MNITGVDFITVPTRDFEKADQFYGEVQKLGGNRWDTSSLLARLSK